MALLALASNILTATVLAGESGNDVIFSNQTGLPIARLMVGNRVLESDGMGMAANGRILVHVSPTKHTLKIVFRGGADVEWVNLNFKGVHEITFFRDQNRIEARVQ